VGAVDEVGHGFGEEGVQGAEFCGLEAEQSLFEVGGDLFDVGEAATAGFGDQDVVP